MAMAPPRIRGKRNSAIKRRETVMENEFASAKYTAGQLNAIVKLLRRQAGENGPERFLRGEVVISEAEPNIFLCLISGGENLILDPTDGTRTIATAPDVFPGWIDPDFERWGTNHPGQATSETPVAVYEMAKDATFAQMFGSLSGDPRRLCLTQGQIINFCQKHRQWLRTDGYATFFLFEVGGKLFVAYVNFSDGGRLRAPAHQFAHSHVWHAEHRPRLVLPQLV